MTDDRQVERISLDEFMRRAAAADALVPFEAAVRTRAAEADSVDDADKSKTEAEWWLEFATFNEFCVIMEKGQGNR